MLILTKRVIAIGLKSETRVLISVDVIRLQYVQERQVSGSRSGYLGVLLLE